LVGEKTHQSRNVEGVMFETSKIPNANFMEEDFAVEKDTSCKLGERMYMEIDRGSRPCPLMEKRRRMV